MPGPVSDSYDSEWGTTSNAADISEAIDAMHAKLSKILNNQPPIYILDLIRMDLPQPISAELTELEWRLLRFACERAKDSL